MPSISGHSKIVLRGDNGRDEEVILSGACKPGQNLKRTTAVRVMEVDTAAVGASAATGGSGGPTGGAPDLMIAKEQSLTGLGIDDALTPGEQIGVYIPGKGDVVLVLALLGEDIDKEEGISFNTAGKAIAATTGLVGKSLDDTGGVLAADTLIRMIVI